MRCVLIGCGKIGSEFADDPRITDVYTHAGAWRACPEVDLAAVCDNDPDRASRCAARWNVQDRFCNAREMLEKVRPELVSICTPDETHAEMLWLALETPGVRGILAEKPLATSLAEARRIAGRAEASGIVIAVNYSRRHAGGHIALAKRVREGLLGDLRQIRGCYTKGTIHNGTHWFDWARMFAGEIVAARGFDGLHEAGTDPTFDARLEFSSDATAILSALSHRDYNLFEMELLGKEGRLRLYDSGHRYCLELAGDSPRYSGYRALTEAESGDADMRDTLLNAATDLLASLRDGRRPACTAPDAVAALAIADAVRRSAAADGALMQVLR